MDAEEEEEVEEEPGLLGVLEGGALMCGLGLVAHFKSVLVNKINFNFR